MLQELSSLIIDADLNSRSRLREALKSIIFRGTIAYARTLKEGLEILSGEANYDLVFMSSPQERTVILSFLKSAREVTESKQTRFILTLDANHQDPSYVAALYVEGAHGFVCEPYSVDLLRNLIETSRDESVGADPQKRQESAASFLVADAMRHVDTLSDNRLQGIKGGGYALKDLKETSQSLKEIAEKMPEAFAEIMLRKFENAQPTALSAQRKKTIKKDKHVPHPGEIMRELIAQRGLSNEQLIPVLKIDEAQLSLLLAEQIPVTEELARDLSRALGRTAKYWLALQAEYDQAKETEKKPEV